MHRTGCRAAPACVLLLLLALPGISLASNPNDDADASSNAAAAAAAVAATAERSMDGQGQSGSNGFIVVLKHDPVVSYRGGGVAAMSATAVDTQPTGQKLDVTAAAVVRYASFLEAQAAAVAARAGISSGVAYKYKYAFSGFAVHKLSPQQRAALGKDPDVAYVAANRKVQTQTLTTPSFLGLAGAARNGNGGLWSKQFNNSAKAGAGVVIGVIDTGIWPEHPSFNDRSGASKTGGFVYSPVTQQLYSGTCQSGERFTPDLCNRKLVGCQYFRTAWDSSSNSSFKDGDPQEVMSCRDSFGHGTHTAATAAGNFGLRFMNGSLAGMAPKARIAAYKVCWGAAGKGYDSDIIAAIDAAVSQGVDVINYSVGGETAYNPDTVALAFMRAAKAGVLVAAAAGNRGVAGPVLNAHPWVITVAASTHNRLWVDSSSATVLLGDGSSYTGASYYNPGLGPAPVLLANQAARPGTNVTRAQLCYFGSLDPNKVQGAIVVCDRGANTRLEKSAAVKYAGGAGMLLLNGFDPGLLSLDSEYHSVPTIQLQVVFRDAVRAYAATRGATATMLPLKQSLDATAPQMADFSSRGPDPLTGRTLLKPDLVAPGVKVVAATTPNAANLYSGGDGLPYATFSGTSMATPHVAGLAALLRQKYPHWSPMAIKSALMTTAYQTTRTGSIGEPIGNNPFDYGAGHVDPNSMFNPGLVFDSSYADWAYWVCATKSPDDIGLPDDLEMYCRDCTAETVPPSRCDPVNLNMPSIAVADLIVGRTKEVVRTVKSVLSVPATFTAAWGVRIGDSAYLQVTNVTPASFVLGPGESQQLSIAITATEAPLNRAHVFGFITWTSDQGTSTRIPLSANVSTVLAPAEVAVPPRAQSLTYKVTTGFTGALQLQRHGLLLSTVTSGALGSALTATTDFMIPEGTKVARFRLYETDLAVGSVYDLDLYVYQGNNTDAPVGQSTSSTSEEVVTLLDPAPGAYRVLVTSHNAVPSMQLYLHSWLLGSKTEANFAAPDALGVTKGGATEITLLLSGSMFNGVSKQRYLGYVDYFKQGIAVGCTLVSMETQNILAAHGR